MRRSGLRTPRLEAERANEPDQTAVTMLSEATAAAAVGAQVERGVRPVAWADDAAVQGCVGNCASAAAKEYWERGHWVDKASAEKLRHPLYAAQTLWNACAQAGEVERGKLDPLLRRSLVQLRKWADWYGHADHAARGQLPLPPAGDVELTEDISAALGPNDRTQPAPTAAQEHEDGAK